MTELMNRTRQRGTEHIPIGRMSEQDVCQRMIPRKAYLDANAWAHLLTDRGTYSIPEVPKAPLIPKPSAPPQLGLIGAGCGALLSHILSGAGWNLVALKEAKNELLNLNKAAINVYISSSLANRSDLSTFGLNFIFSDEEIIHCQSHRRLLAEQMLGEESKETQHDDTDLPSFYKPITFDWTKKDDELMEAARKYSEQTDANY